MATFKRPIVVCDIGLNHNGDMGLAKAMIAMAASQGVDYVKFQARTVNECYKQEYLDRKRVSKFGTTVRDEKNALEFTEAQFRELGSYCDEHNIGWFITPFTEKDVDLCLNLGRRFLKVASQCVSNLALVERIKSTAVPVIASTGMSTLAEMCALKSFLGDQLLYILHCVSTYPTEDRDVNLLAIQSLRASFPDTLIGFSSHSEKVIYPVAAAILGADMIEFHITLDRNLPGPDHAASIGPTGLDRIMSHLRSVYDGMGNGLVVPRQEALSKGANYKWR